MTKSGQGKIYKEIKKIKPLMFVMHKNNLPNCATPPWLKNAH